MSQTHCRPSLSNNICNPSLISIKQEIFIDVVISNNLPNLLKASVIADFGWACELVNIRRLNSCIVNVISLHEQGHNIAINQLF